MSNSLKLPPVHTATIDSATVAQLFTDLAACAQITAIHPRVPNGQTPPTLSLDEARQGFLSGSITSLQIHYQHDNKTWCDTLLASANGTRLVRISNDDIAQSL